MTTSKSTTVTTAAAVCVIQDAIASKYDPAIVTTFRAPDSLKTFCASLSALGVPATAQELPVTGVSVPQALAALGAAIRSAYRLENSERAYDAGRKWEVLKVTLMSIGVAIKE